ncbi:hypothetical protein [Microcoleus anatoxicus]|uniref:Uncharacterized protein n=1 Tax=Microcoleus anatoxicus PTRS2 TaxID=2705321 RepID=A0ABU8YS55_9CYAN
MYQKSIARTVKHQFCPRYLIIVDVHEDDRTLRVGRLTITYSSPIPGILALLWLRLLFESDR